MTNQPNDDKIISRVVFFAVEFTELPAWFTDKFRSWKPEAREKYFRLVLPLVGYRHVGKGLAALGALWLTGETRTPEFLRESDRIIKGGPVQVSSRENKTLLRSLLRNQIVQSGEPILAQDFDPAVLSAGTAELNKLVNQYLQPEFAPFQPAGGSHIDFIAERIDRPGKDVVSLGLDIQVSTG